MHLNMNLHTLCQNLMTNLSPNKTPTPNLNLNVSRLILSFTFDSDLPPNISGFGPKCALADVGSGPAGEGRSEEPVWKELLGLG